MDAGTEDHPDLGALSKDREHFFDGFKGGGEVGVPEADVFQGCVVESVEEALADDAGFTLIDGVIKDCDPGWDPGLEGFEDGAGGVSATVVDEDEMEVGVAGDVGGEDFDGEAGGLVVAGDDDCAGGHCEAFWHWSFYLLRFCRPSICIYGFDRERSKTTRVLNRSRSYRR